jgi:subtilisin family serine protease
MFSSAPWSLQDQQVHLDQAFANFPSINGAGETIAVIDRGVDYNHPDLGGAMGQVVIDSWNFDNNSPDVFPYDNDAHGTGTASQLAGQPHVVDRFAQDLRELVIADRAPLDELREHRPRHAGSFKIATAGHAFATEKRAGLGFGSVHGAGVEREMRDLRFLGTFA